MPRLDESQFSVEDLKSMRLFLTSKGRPTSDMTDEIWQKLYVQLKKKVEPYRDGSTKRMNARCSVPVINDWGVYEEDKTSDWKRYCMFINSALDDIRGGQHTLCFYYYQILQLLKFHKETLRTKYNKKDTYWEVWLEKQGE